MPSGTGIKRADTTGSGSRCLRIHLCTRLALSPWLSATPATEAPDWAHSSMTWALKALGNVRRCRDTKPSRKWLEMVSTKNRCTPCRYLEEAGRWVRRTVTMPLLDQGAEMSFDPVDDGKSLILGSSVGGPIERLSMVARA